ncbi:MAG: head-tail connector protein [Pseudomonadota bacterium]|jgi:uncharacterized phiE125 gp8 family phage protein|nr:head-tail connector protein [Alphaproteobacteria bacterium]
MQLKRLLVTSDELVPLEELKEHMRIEHEDEDSLLKSLLRSAYDWVEQFTNRSLLTTQWCFKSLPLKKGSEINICLPFPDLIRIESVHHVFTPDHKELLRRFVIEEKNGLSYVCLLSKGVPIEIIYKSGFGESFDKVPEAIRQAIKVLAASWHENREGSFCGIPDTLRTFLHPYQVRRLV